MEEFTGEAKDAMETLIVDVRNKTCPIPLVETRKALRKAGYGMVVEVIGTSASSKGEISMAVKELGLVLLGIEEENGIWKILIRNVKTQ